MTSPDVHRTRLNKGVIAHRPIQWARWVAGQTCAAVSQVKDTKELGTRALARLSTSLPGGRTSIQTPSTRRPLSSEAILDLRTSTAQLDMTNPRHEPGATRHWGVINNILKSRSQASIRKKPAYRPQRTQETGERVTDGDNRGQPQPSRLPPHSGHSEQSNYHLQSRQRSTSPKQCSAPQSDRSSDQSQYRREHGRKERRRPGPSRAQQQYDRSRVQTRSNRTSGQPERSSTVTGAHKKSNDQAQQSASARQQMRAATRYTWVLLRSNDPTTPCTSDRSVQCFTLVLNQKPCHRSQRPRQQAPLLKVSIILSVNQGLSSQLDRLATAPRSKRSAVSRRQQQIPSSRLHQPRRVAAAGPSRDP
jgi:hypothetical protein